MRRAAVINQIRGLLLVPAEADSSRRVTEDGGIK
jgi:hypothetical protein